MIMSSQVYFLKKAIQVLIPIYILFSLFFFQPWLFNAVLNYVDHYIISTFSIKLFHYNTERNYVFLLFNGILAVILKNSGLISKLPMDLSQEDSRKVVKKKNKKKNNHRLPHPDDAEFSIVEEEVVNGKAVKKTEEEEERGRQNGIPVTESATEYTQGPAEEINDELIMIKTEGIFSDENQEQEQEQEDEEEEEEEHGLMSADELHRKCEEFIKKMREGIKVEFHQPIRV